KRTLQSESEKRDIVKENTKESNKQTYEDQKKIKSLNNKLSNLEAKIQQLEKQIKEMDVELATNYDEAVSNPKFFDGYQSKKQELETLLAEWEILQKAIENL